VEDAFWMEDRETAEWEEPPIDYERIAQGLGSGMTHLQDTVCETIMAIDNELRIVKDLEYRQVLVNTAYRLNDLRTRMQLQRAKSSLKSSLAS
jgi:hypothetical protein